MKASVLRLLVFRHRSLSLLSKSPKEPPDGLCAAGTRE
jgi:hypothetical protein